MEEHKYEITYIIRPDMEEGAKNDLVTKFDKVLTDNGAKIMIQKTGQSVVLLTKSPVTTKVYTTSLT